MAAPAKRVQIASTHGGRSRLSSDWHSLIEGFCSGLRRKFEAGRSKALPADLEWMQSRLHDKEAELNALIKVQSDRLAGLVQMLRVDDQGALRHLTPEEAKDMQRRLLAVSWLRSGEVPIGPSPLDERRRYTPGRLVLDRSGLPCGVDGLSTESVSLGSYADDIESLGNRIDVVADELRRLRGEFESELHSM